MSQTAADVWRGIAVDEDEEELTASLSVFMRRRSLRLLGELCRPEWSRLITGTIFTILHSLAGLAIPLIVGLGIDKGITPALRRGGSLRGLYPIIGVFLVVQIIEAATLRGFLAQIGLVGERVLLRLRTRVYDHFQKLSVAFYEKFTTGRMMSRLGNDIDAIAELFLTGIIDLPWAILQVLGIVVILLVLDLPLAAVTLAIFPFVFLLSRWFRNKTEVIYRNVRQAVALVYIQFNETLGGIRAVHAFRREPRNQEIFEDIDARYRDANMDGIKAQAVYGPGTGLLGELAMFAVLLVGGWRVAGGQMKLGVLISFLLYTRNFFHPIQELSQVYNIFQAAASALEKLSGLLDEKPSVPEPAPENAVTRPAWGGRIDFDDVTFGYRDRNILANVRLNIPAAQTVALVGPTGAGKTTIARLVARFYDPNTGRVTIDGVDLRDLPSSELRKAIIMVTQENFLFNGTIADNIAFGKPTATREEIERAARVVGAHTFIETMPDGFDTDIRKRGGRLSAGQRQLVALARAFLADPAVIIFDEATSSIDMPSERLVQKALEFVLRDRTAFIIAHRLATVAIADRVLVIDDGRVVEDGSPIELLHAGGRWAALHEAWEESLA
ncbi:MAG TPA: ABC transporter ATP-binding protein [Actinomycetota bacterium]|nr:ABC transporter ATP-binding protein [Actinomycetota bacterium]